MAIHQILQFFALSLVILHAYRTVSPERGRYGSVYKMADRGRGTYLERASSSTLASPPLLLDHTSSHSWGVISIHGEDRVRFIQGLGTNDFKDAPEGSFFTTAFLNAKGVCLEHVTVLALQHSFKILCETQESTRTLLDYFNKFLL